VGRSRERSEATAQQIRDQTGNSSVQYLLADLSSQAEIRRLAGEIQGRYPQLHVLLNNAGGMFLSRRESVDGIEMTFALNHLAYFLLTNLLLDRLKAAGTARVICVASDAHRFARGIDFDDLQRRKRYRGFRVYAESKLANILFTSELARRLAGTGVAVNALHPGFVATSFFTRDHMKGPVGAFMKASARFFAIDPEQGAATSVYLATSPEVEGITGRYFERCRQVAPSRAALDEAAARRLWQISEEMTRSGYQAAVDRS
jgi:NAD(P)-dependent dehydrogenase (short-subunit alcohol dehydrogenase family)